MSNANFTVESVSIAGAPTISFHFSGDVGRAQLGGAELYAEYAGDDRIAMRLTDASGEVLADLTLNHRPHRTTTENLTDVGSALLWSHWRFQQQAATQQAATR